MLLFNPWFHADLIQQLFVSQADLRRADMVVRRRAMEDAFMALKVA